MKILGVDTSTKFLCLGIYDDGKVYEYNLEVARQLSSLLALTIKRLLDALSLRINDIDYFACGLGPGSFTGLRTGLSAVKGFCWVTKKPIIGISTLDILAKYVRDTDNPIVPIIDAKRSLIYCSIFKNRLARLARIGPYMLLSEENFFKNIPDNSLILGDAIDLYRDKILKQIKGAIILDRDYWYPKAHNIVALALERIRDKKFDNPFDIKPIYLYPKECQIRVESRE